jgi:2,3-bisphosphoglycerate-dependent phosphoglycerate mutase
VPPETSRTFRQLRFERPEGATELLLVRHGESAPADIDSPFALVQGRGDPELSPEGRAQAEALAERLGDWPISAIYTTPLRRTAETAAPLARRLGIDPIVDPGLIEVHMGEWEGGRYRQKITERDPLALRIFAEGRFDVVPGAESNASIIERANAAVRRIVAAHPGAIVVVVSHVVVISALLSQAIGAPTFAFVTGDNSSISRLVIDGETWTMRGYNDTAHLEGR